jgi:5,10-methylenetetrahydromethanopterin reductase
MRLGLAFIPGMPAEVVVDLVREAEHLGYDDVYLPDQTFHRDPWALLALCAAATSRVRLGLALTNPYTRHPIEIARASGTLADISGGRFVLGLGAGNRGRVLAGHGIEQRGIVTRLRESITVIRALLAGETVDHHSETLTVKSVALDFVSPHPVPIFIGTRGPKMLALAGELADGVFAEALFTPGAFAWARDQVAAGALQAGRSAGEVEMVAWQSLALGDSADIATAAAYRRWAALIIGTTRPNVLSAIGVSDDSIRAVAAEQPRNGEASGADIPGSDVGKLLMVGTPDDIVKAGRGARKTGASGLVGIVLGAEDTIRDTMRRFAADVMPELRAGVRRPQVQGDDRSA